MAKQKFAVTKFRENKAPLLMNVLCMYRGHAGVAYVQVPRPVLHGSYIDVLSPLHYEILQREMTIAYNAAVKQAVWKEVQVAPEGSFTALIFPESVELDLEADAEALLHHYYVIGDRG